ncbi:DUF4167 domain-containing protein [Acidisoma cellulosilytica]|uniref:DUF4167 domain-containing protein n=1 Tax=Acidisoma cellulosilyticum TaxID=2802395 RepID=A0A964E3X2_9PROT|nr:DUF4167 domain-containing protein [Acidisoma cellulosilyticum]MCB8880846.1 DUF4167 domain-containing protein [Acidisoma cellulosilyticum]
MNIKRMRGRGHRGNGPNGGGGGGNGGGGTRHPSSGGSNSIPLNRNHVFDSNGPDLRIRGTAQQLFEKYLQLGRDATSAGDRVMGEGYFQHAEHYFRIVSAMNQAAAQHQQQPAHQNNQNRRNSNDDGSVGEEFEGGQGRDESDDGRPAMEAREIPIAVAAPEA